MTKTIDEKLLYIPSSKLSDSVKLWFSFPAPYHIGMSALGYLSLFSKFDQNPKADPERYFTDTTKTKHKSNEVELIGFSFSFEFDFINIFKELEKLSIPLYAKDRDENSPLIFAGGPVMTANPEPFCQFFDFIMIGDGEDSSEEIINILYDNKTLSRKEKILKLSEIEGIYVPSLYNIEYNDDFTLKEIIPDKKIKKRTKKNLECIFSPIVTSNTMFANNCLVEVARGCPCKCAFCLASYSNLPFRHPPYEEIIKAIDDGIKYAGKVGLLGALVSAHPKFDEICDYISDKLETEKFEVSISSLRTDRLNPKTIKMLVKGGQKSSTIAFEAGSQRMRNYINKNLNEEQIFNSIKIAAENGLSSLKIYSMIGLPNETMEDIIELEDLMKRLNKQFKNISLILSSSSFVPKANTPFQWYGRESTKSIKKKNDYLKKHLHMAGIKYRPTSVKWDNIQALFSKGDRRLAPVLVEFYKYSASLGSINRAYKTCIKENPAIPPFDWYTEREISRNELLPWDFIEQEYSKGDLINEFNRLQDKLYTSSGK